MPPSTANPTLDQLSLFEPTPSEVPALTTAHLRQADRARRSADVFRARGMWALAAAEDGRAALHEAEAECLAMLAEFYGLAGLRK